MLLTRDRAHESITPRYATEPMWRVAWPCAPEEEHQARSEAIY
jgi:hypothetical protein